MDKTALGPAQEKERVVVLDVLRGFAVFGILLVNMASFSAPVRLPGYVAPPQGPLLDGIVAELIAFFAVGKFYSLFSFLFGLGFALQMSRAQAKGARFFPTYMRRLLLLMCIGLAHTVLLWEGDILAMYAVLGFGLLLFRHCSASTILVSAGLFLMLSFGTLSISYVQKYGQGGIGNAPRTGASSVVYDTPADEALAVYSHGSYVEAASYRIANLGQDTLFLFLEQGASAFAMFLLGLYAGRRRVIEDASVYVPFIRRWLFWSLIVAFAGNMAFVVGEAQDHMRLALAGFSIGAPMLCLCYVAGITTLMQNANWRQRLYPLAAVGRMALTNYLFQSLVCTTIFYGYGLALYGRISTTAGVLITLAIYPVQVVLSGWWLRRFRFGPIEWLWRTLTYGKRQPLRRIARAVSG